MAKTKPSVVAKTLKVLTYVKFIVAGAIGGLAVVNTFTQVMHGVGASNSVEQIAMALGASLMVGTVTFLHAA